MSAQSNGQASRSPTSSLSQPPYLSSAVGGIQAVPGNIDGSRDAYTRNLLLKTDRHSRYDGSFTGDSDQYNGVQEEFGHKKQRSSNSGVFLLQPLSGLGSQSESAKISLHRVSENVMGKRKIEQGDLAIPKRRTTRHHQHKRAVVGNSPLSAEVYNTVPARGEGISGGSSRDEALSIPLRISPTFYTPVKNNVISEIKEITERHEPRPGVVSALGHDTDPAQIVNLALNLSESRRRTFSAGRSPPINTLDNRRIPSMVQHNSTISNDFSTTAGGGSLRQYLQQQRQASRNVSPRSSKRRDRDISLPSTPRKIISQAQQIPSSNFEIGLADDVYLTASDATLARAEKARLSLELCYEYRRLLQYLPAIPSGKHTLSLSRSTTKSKLENESPTRLYNPLQYIRNRRLRGREGRMLDAEAEGWKDLDRVRKWIDIIAGERGTGATAVNDDYLLPAFESLHRDPVSEDASTEHIAQNSTLLPAHKPRRPKLDWSITPWDLLADAYWLHQDDNLRRIEDTHGSKIILGKHNNQETPSRSSRESARSPTRRSKSITRQLMTPEKLSSLISSSRDASKERGRRQQRVQESKSLLSNEVSSRDRKRRWPRGLTLSRNSSSSGESIEDKEQAHFRDSGFFVSRDHPDSAALEKQMRELVKKEAEAEILKDTGKSEQRGPPSKEETRLNHRDKGPADETLINSDIRRMKATQRSQHVRSASDQIPSSGRGSLDGQRRGGFRYSLDEPGTPGSQRCAPHEAGTYSITEPSTPISRPGTPKRSVHSRLRSFRQLQAKETQFFEGDSTCAQPKAAKDSSEQETVKSKAPDLPYKERHTNLGKGLLSPMTVEPLGRKSRLVDRIRTTKDPHEPESKFRGFFKGGRIAELVGNEVHKVGDRIWRKESSNNLAHASLTGSNDVSEESDLEADTSAMDSSPENYLSCKTTEIDDSVREPPNPTAIDRPKYHINHLPSFRSPFSREEHLSNISKGSLSDDHITRQQEAQRARGRSSRFDRLAPPRIDVEGISPTSSPPITRVQTRDTEASYDGSRSSASQSDARVREADKRLNRILGSPGIVGFSGPPVSLLSGLESRQRNSSDHANVQGESRWSISDRAPSIVLGAVSKRDIARARALLLSSGVKANEIVRRGKEARDVPSALLCRLQETSNRYLPHVPRSQEHILAARILINNIDASNQQLREAAENFSDNIVENLHKQLQAIDEHITHKLTPSVRAAADDADGFSGELTTTHTLAVKQLHNSVDIILRKRRRRFRWIRRGGYVLLEWTLLGIMWWVWLVVVIIRLVRCTVGAVNAALRWLFWV